MYHLNTIEKEYPIEELKQDWMFKLLCKFLKQHGLFISMTKDHKKFHTMHSCNYCIPKMFFLTITVTVPYSIRSGNEKYKYDKLWTDFILEHLNCVPLEIKERCICPEGKTFEDFILYGYKKHYFEDYKKKT